MRDHDTDHDRDSAEITTDDSSPFDDGSDGETDDEDRGDGIGRTGPLSDLADAVDEGRRARPDTDGDGSSSGSSPGSTTTTSPHPSFEDLFDREDVTDLDSERLWERLEDDTAAEGDLECTDDDREIRDIDTGSYCHQCEHFAAPPEVRCTREGTEILELTAMERFRVADCPVVLEDEALEQRY